MTFDLQWSAIGMPDGLQEPQLLELSGTINFDNAAAICQRGEELILDRKPDSLLVDIGKVDSANSALFSILLRWMQLAGSHSMQFGVRGVSSRLMDVARVSGLETVIPLENG
jgi:phospholipid transport system transporter-binding protein